MKAVLMMKLRRRLENSKVLASVIGAIALGYISLCRRTTRWEAEGLSELQEALADGPVILVAWHSRLLMAASHWPLADGPLASLHTSSPIARVIGATQRQIGLEPFEMSEKTSNLVASRMILKRVKEGVSIGITADGPLGPALALKSPPIDWARATGLPVFCYAFATARAKRANSWDKMLIPLPFTRGAYVFARFDKTVPRKIDSEAMEALRVEMEVFIANTTARADRMIGNDPGP